VGRFTGNREALSWAGGRRETGNEREVKVLFDQDLARHIAPEPCVVMNTAVLPAISPALVPCQARGKTS
jgi:hypothetical protein